MADEVKPSRAAILQDPFETEDMSSSSAVEGSEEGSVKLNSNLNLNTNLGVGLDFFVFKLKNSEVKSVVDLIKQDPALIAPGGGISFDSRTNVLFLSDSKENIEKIKKLLSEIDIPIDQILIEARVVEVEKSALRELGVTQGVNPEGALLPNMIMGNNNPIKSGVVAGANGILNNGIINPAGALGFTLQKLPGGFLLDLELQALEAEGEAQVISAPKLTVLNHHEALIQQGAEVPYLSAALNGATQVQFKKAVLSLKVTPEILSEGKILLNLQVNKDKVSTISLKAEGTPVIDTREINTQVEVESGQTLVLGGIYEELETEDVRGIPVLKDLPGIGWLFRTKHKEEESSEMLIFITPKILKN